jgi:hypothetical protein
MKKSIVFIVVLSMLMITPEVFAQKTKRDKKNKKEKTKTEQTTNGVSNTGNNDVKESTVTVKPVETTASQKPVAIVPEEVVDFEQLMESSTPLIQQKPNGSVNWSDQHVEAKGSAVIDYERFPNPAQAKAMATRGAVVVAQRNLLEILQGVNVVSETTVKDMMIQSDYIYTRVDGIVKGAQQVGEAVEKDGMIEVTMRVPLYETNGLAPAVYDGVANLPGMQNRLFPADVEVGDGDVPSGLVFNFNGKQYDPSLFPLVVDENGKILLDMTQFYNPEEGKFPKILSSTKEIFTELNFSKGTQVIDVIESFDGKIVVDPNSVKKINWDKIQKGISTATKIFKFILTVI